METLEDYIELSIQPQLDQGTYVDFERTQIGGVPAVSYRLVDGPSPRPIINYVVENNGFYYKIRIQDSIETNKDREANLDRFNTMLETFEFTDPN